MKQFNEWPIIYEDDELISRRNPADPEEYVINIKNTKNFVTFPRDMLEEVAMTNRNNGRRLIDRMVNPDYVWNFSENGRLNYDSIIAAIDKTYIKESQKFINPHFS